MGFLIPPAIAALAGGTAAAATGTAAGAIGTGLAAGLGGSAAAGLGTAAGAIGTAAGAAAAGATGGGLSTILGGLSASSGLVGTAASLLLRPKPPKIPAPPSAPDIKTLGSGNPSLAAIPLGSALGGTFKTQGQTPSSANTYGKTILGG